MSALKTEKYRYWLTYLTRDLPVGATFAPEDIHLSVLNWFVVDIEQENTLITSFEATFSNNRAFELEVEGEVNLGPREDVSVYLVSNSPTIRALHMLAIEWFEKLNAKWAVKHPYADDEYLPHIRRRPNMQLKQGDKINFNSLILVKALRRADDRRWVYGKVMFDD